MIHEYDVVVLGAGPSGQKAAIQAAKAGKRVLVIDRDPQVGGACVHRGTIPSKTLRETAVALVGFKRRSGGVFEIPASEDLQIASLMTRLEEVVSGNEEYIGRQLARNGVTVWHGRASFSSPHDITVQSVRGEQWHARAGIVVIATGSRPRSPAEVHVDHEHVLDSDSILSMTYLPRSLAVLGAGVIASEYASVFAALGVQVVMVDKAERPVGFIDPELTTRFVKSFGQLGGRFVGGVSVLGVQWDGVGSVVTLLSNGEVLRTDKALFALGRVANVDELNLAAAGLSLTQRGLLDVDAHCRTAAPHIYAVGDVIGPPSLASSSAEQGRRAVCHALGLSVGMPAEFTPLGVYTVPEMAAVGLTEAQAVAQLGSALVGRARFDEVARGRISAVEDGLLKLVADPKGERLLGVHVIGEGASELVHIGQMALMGGLGIDTFIETIFNFPTLAEAYRVAAFDVVKQREQLKQSAA
ncbi:MAG TPA: Si-specific NAD(P)(+) transhydrogenase [Polyangiaceae bacterium]|jgi:NAD(P) transhydrogenase|nr:Si-specific NAD(P)(+) transhydrogenase [Polyangiaceae bacterium]